MIKKGSILITGATDGIGFELAKNLSQVFQNVIVHGRDEKKCESVIKKIKLCTGNDNLLPLAFNLENIKEIQKGVSDISKYHSDIKIVINNAGMFTKKYELTIDNIEKMFMVNHFSQFILIHELLSLENIKLKRIINTGSLAHLHIKFDVNLIGDSINFNAYKAYSSSKLYCLMHSYLLSKKLKDRDIFVNCYDPGFFSTKLTRNGWEIPPSSNMDNAINTITAIINNNYETGAYISNQEVIDGSKCSQNLVNLRALWNYDMLLYERKKNVE